MNIVYVKNNEQMSLMAADIIASSILHKPDAILGLATGSTPIETYALLVAKYKVGALDFSQVRTFNLDEYAGLAPDHEQSYRYFMNHHLFNHTNIAMENTHLPLGNTSDHEKQCAEYEKKIEAVGGIDLQLLGIGSNGHVGFNEPADVFYMKTNVQNLSAATLSDNKRFFKGENEVVPSSALTTGFGQIMAAKSVLLLAGNGKQEIVQKAFYGDVTPQIPASCLQFHHNCTVIAVR